MECRKCNGYVSIVKMQCLECGESYGENAEEENNMTAEEVERIGEEALEKAREVLGADPAYFGKEGEAEVDRQLKLMGYSLAMLRGEEPLRKREVEEVPKSLPMLRCHDDGKGKYQSFTVWSDAEFAENIIPGYGATFEEALKNYQKEFDKHIAQLQKYNIEVVKGKNF